MGQNTFKHSVYLIFRALSFIWTKLKQKNHILAVSHPAIPPTAITPEQQRAHQKPTHEEENNQRSTSPSLTWIHLSHTHTETIYSQHFTRSLRSIVPNHLIILAERFLYQYYRVRPEFRFTYYPIGFSMTLPAVCFTLDCLVDYPIGLPATWYTQCMTSAWLLDFRFVLISDVLDCSCLTSFFCLWGKIRTVRSFLVGSHSKEKFKKSTDQW